MTETNAKRAHKLDAAPASKLLAIPARRRKALKTDPVAQVPVTTKPIAKLNKPTKPTKRDQLAALLLRDEGATLNQMIAATGWLPHTTRAALTGLRKTGYAIDSDKLDGVRTYRAAAPK